MGNTNGKIEHYKDKSLNKFSDNYDFIRDVADQRLGEIQVYKFKHHDE
jgi:hypothetical protein